MRTELKQLADQAIQLELNIGQLYKLFSDFFPEDADFWWQLAKEESNHAALITTGIDFFMDQGLFPYNILLQNLDELRTINQEVTELAEKYETETPSRQTAFWTAMKIENSAGEVHYQNMMACKDGPKMLELFQKLNGDDKDHAERIQAYIKNKGLK